MAIKEEIIFKFDKSFLNKKNVKVAGLDISLNHTGIVILDSDGKVIHQESIIYRLNKKQVNKQRRDIHLITFKINGEMTDQAVDITNYDDHTINKDLRYIVVKKRILALYRKYKFQYAAIESPAIKGNGLKLQLAEISAIVRIVLVEKKVNISMVTPSDLKYFILKKGLGKKEDIMKEIYTQYYITFDDDNEADAFVLARLFLTLGDEISLFLKKGGCEAYFKQKELI